VNGTLQSEFFTMFWPTRLMYSSTTGSVMNLVLFSISMEYILPILISVSTEYQFPIPRAPMSRLPTALTSSMLPGFTLIFWLPGSTTFSGLTATAGVSPSTGVVPGAGGFEEVAAGVSPPTGAVPGAGWAAGVLEAVGVPEPGGVLEAVGGVEEAPPPAGAVPDAGCFAGVAAGVSPPTGAVPGACWTVGALAGVVLDPVDCAHNPVASASDNTASATALVLLKAALITQPPARHTDCPAPLDPLDVSICLFGNSWEE